MNKIVLLILGLTLLVELSVQNCSSSTDCTYSDAQCDPLTPPGQCCRQVAQVLALATASARASALALAAAHTCAHACSGAEVNVFATAAASAHVCITQSVCLSINTGKCCEISTSIAANASSYASAAATASAKAWGAARAAARASASASAASSSAASLYAAASTLITSTCCHFNLRVYSLVEAVGNFSAQASVAVDAAVAVSVSAQAAAQVALNVSSSVQTSTAQLLSAGINNCCIANRTQQTAESTGRAVYDLLQPASDLFEYINDAFDSIEVGVTDYNEIIDPVELKDFLCVSECKDANITCSDCCGQVDPQTVCLAAEVYVLVAMETKALADAVAGALVYAVAGAAARADAQVSLTLAANALVKVGLMTDVNVKSCCSIVVTVSSSATAIANSVGYAIANASAVGQAYAASFASAYAVATALASANASGLATARLSYAGCCGQACANDAPCCAIADLIATQDAGDIASLVANDAKDDSAEAPHYLDALNGISSVDTANVISVVSTQTAYLLQCCCCTKPPTTTTTKRLTFSSSSFTFKSG